MLTDQEIQSPIDAALPQIAQDARPKMTFRVGAIGHRYKSKNVVPTLSVITCEDVGPFDVTQVLQPSGSQNLFAGKLEIVLISPMVEGADR